MANISQMSSYKSLRLFLWNEKLRRNQISQSEGLCVFIINTTFVTVQPSKYTCKTEERNCSTVIPFDLSKLLNKDASLIPMLLSATLQFEPQTIQKLTYYISDDLFTKFQDSQALLPAPRPTYVIAIEICQTRYVNFDDLLTVQPCQSSWCESPAISLEDLMDDTCPVCQDEFKDENEVIVTYCSHAFHARCLLPWLSKKNSCPTCRAVYPLHYSPSLDRQCRKSKHDMVEAKV